MKLKENFKRFWTLSKSRKGFTLVELIVVIAILAILAGVAIPVYNGYIKKAESAADQQLLDSINTAYAAACIANNVDVTELTESTAMIPLSGGKVQINGIKAGDKSADVQADFALFFEGNENSTFKGIKNIVFDVEKLCFMEAEGRTVALPGGAVITLTAEQEKLFEDSTFSSIGAEVLGGQVDSVSNLVAAIIGDSAEEVWEKWGEGDMTAMNSASAFLQLIADESYADSLGLEKDFWTMYQEEGADTAVNYFANSLVISAANASNSLSAETIADAMASDPGNYVNTLRNDIASGSPEALAEVALVYGAYTSYLYSTNPDTAESTLAGINNSGGFMNALGTMQNDANFAEYLTGQGATDMEAYLESLKVISNAANNGSTVDAILSGGFASDEITAIFKDILG